MEKGVSVTDLSDVVSGLYFSLQPRKADASPHYGSLYRTSKPAIMVETAGPKLEDRYHGKEKPAEAKDPPKIGQDTGIAMRLLRRVGKGRGLPFKVEGSLSMKRYSSVTGTVRPENSRARNYWE